MSYRVTAVLSKNIIQFKRYTYCTITSEINKRIMYIMMIYSMPIDSK